MGGQDREEPGLRQAGETANAMGFPPALWFGDDGRGKDDLLLAALKTGP